MFQAESTVSGFFFLAPWLVFAPVIGLLINLIFGKRFSETMIGTVASLASGAAFVVSVLLAYSLAANHGEVVRWRLAEWIHIGELHLDWTFRVDSLSTTMMLVVSGVGTLIHIYAIGYMHEDVRFKNDIARYSRFFVFLNLFINAKDAMPEGGVIEVGTRSEIDSGCFWVADTGCGMSPETAARIFEPFFTTKGTNGTGLGLSASHGIISRHAGEIFAVSEPGEGTRFEVRLPVSDPISRSIKTQDEGAT